VNLTMACLGEHTRLGSAGEKEYRRSFSPGDAEAHESYGFSSAPGQACRGSRRDGIARRQSISTKLNLLTGLVLYSDHRYDEALASFHRVLELSPSLGAERHMLRVYEQRAI
jgi:hypothetical protein